MTERENLTSISHVQNDEMTLKEIILKTQGWMNYFLSLWKVFLMTAMFGGCVGLIYSFIQSPIYTAATTFVLEEENGSSGGVLGQLGGLAGIAGINVNGGGGLFQGENILELYVSRSMVEKTLLTRVDLNGKNQLLIDRYIEFNNLRDQWDGDLKLIDFNIELKTPNKRLQDSVLGKIVEDIKTNYLSVNKPDKKLSIIRVEVKAPDELFAKLLNDNIVMNVNDFYVQTKTKKSLQNIQILQHQTDSVRRVLDGAIYQTASITDATPNLNVVRQTLRSPALKSQFNAEANKAILTQLVQNLELSKLALRKETPLIQVIDSPIYPLAKVKLGKLKALLVGGFLSILITAIIIVLTKIYRDILDAK